MEDFMNVRILLSLALIGCTTDPTAEVSQDVRARPSPRGYSAMVYDSQSAQYVMLGGVTTGLVDTPDVWAADSSGTEWLRVGTLPAGPVVVAAYDSDHDRTVVWVPTRPRPDGGGDLEPFLPADAISETWTYDLDSNRWEQVATAGPPVGVLGARMSYDAQSRKMILFGGFDVPTGSFHDETWAFDLDTHQWTNMQPATHPTARNFHGQTYHAAADLVIAYGGMDISFEPTNHVWTYDYDHNTWAQLASPDAPARDYVNIAYVDDRIVLYGGMLYGEDFTELPQQDTWEYDLNSWHRTSDGPGPRAHHVMAAQGDKLLVFGGGPSFDNLTNDVWEYRPRQARWKQR
jgi:N-acetylneuraminic acid mutarotase